MELRTLVLSPHWMPHQIKTWQAAICLLYKEKAEVLETYDATVSSPSVTLKVPSVIRLVRDIGRRSGLRFSRANMLKRDGCRCCYCGEKKSPKELTYDHIVPRSRWRGHPHMVTSWLNVVMACKPCNGKKGDRTPREAGMKMHYQPRIPTDLALSSPMLIEVNSMPEMWKKYLLPMSRTA